MSNIIKSNNAFPKVLLIGLSLLLFSSVISCDSRAQERQLIIDYIDTMMPVMGAHADWYEDQNILFRTSIVFMKRIASPTGKISLNPSEIVSGFSLIVSGRKKITKIAEIKDMAPATNIGTE